MNTVWIVSGQTGAYEDYRSWSVAALPDESSANAMRDRLNAWCKEHGVDSKMNVLKSWLFKLKPPDDPQFECFSTGTEYFTFSLPFISEARP